MSEQSKREQLEEKIADIISGNIDNPMRMEQALCNLFEQEMKEKDESYNAKTVKKYMDKNFELEAKIQSLQQRITELEQEKEQLKESIEAAGKKYLESFNDLQRGITEIGNADIPK